MEVTRILAEIDAQIAKLQQARVLLSGPAGIADAVVKKGVGRPRKGAASVTAVKQVSSGRAKRNLSPEARKRIADAQKRRWAERRNES